MKLITLFYSIVLIFVFSGCKIKNKGITVKFPEIKGPIQITGNDKEHLFASYYGINSFDRSQKHVTVLETDIRNKLPGKHDAATLGLVELTNYKFTPLTEVHTWNFQQGCMAHWLGSSPDSLIIYNDLREEKFVSVIMNVHTKEEIKILPHPVSAVSPDGREAISINFARLRLTRPDYGYDGEGQNSLKDIAFPEDDGLLLMDIETGNTKLLVSYQQIKELVPPITKGNIAWFNHTLFSRKGNRIFWLSRQINEGKRITTSFTVNRDGTELLRSFPDDWGGSHYDWLNDNELMITAKYQGKQDAHILFTPGKKDYKRLGYGLLDYDGHGTFSPDGNWMVTDTYPSRGMNEQKIYLMNMKTEAVISLGRFMRADGYGGHWRCDIHCRWSPDGDIIGFNSTHNGSRQVYIFTLSF